MAGHEVKVFSNSARGTGQLAVRLAPFDALVLIRERTTLSAALLARLPNLKLISQTGKVSGHIDVAAATARGIVIAEGVGDPSAPVEKPVRRSGRDVLNGSHQRVRQAPMLRSQTAQFVQLHTQNRLRCGRLIADCLGHVGLHFQP